MFSITRYLKGNQSYCAIHFQDFILDHYSETPENFEGELELFENLRKVCQINKLAACTQSIKIMVMPWHQDFGSSVYFVLITEDEIILSVFQTC